MAVSQKIKPKTVDLSASLSMLNGTDSVEPTPVEVSQQIQTGAPKEVKPENQVAAAPSPVTKDTQIIFRTTESNKNSLKGFFATYGFTLSKGIQLACFYLEQEIKAGNVTLGPAGIVKKER